MQCLDDQWHGYAAEYRFRCDCCGHEWMRDSRWVSCQRCSYERGRERRRAADGSDRLQRLARERGGTCLADRYLGHSGRVGFRCAEGHEWETEAATVLRGAWCRICADKRCSSRLLRADGLQALEQAALSQGGRCLSTEYGGVAQRYLFRCREGHDWRATGNRILRGAWCPRCVNLARSEALRDPHGLERLHASAQRRGGQCLSTQYEGAAAFYAFRCSKGHEWKAIGASVLAGSWCRPCQHDRRRLTLEDAQEAARRRGGRCLSEHYVNNATKMMWQCDRGHVWSTRFELIRRGTWCPDCAHLAQISDRKSKARARYRPQGEGYLAAGMAEDSPG